MVVTMNNLTALAGLTVSGAGISYLPVDYSESAFHAYVASVWRDRLRLLDRRGSSFASW